MSIKKSLLALAAAALASMAFASMALAATDGTVRHVTTNNPMGVGVTLHYVGWAKFLVKEGGSYECHVTAETVSTSDTTANVTKFTVPDTTKCTGTFPLNNCVLATHNLDGSSPTVTATPTDFSVLGLKLENTYTGCAVTKATLDFTTDADSFLTLKPLKTGTRTVTGTGNRLGTTAAAGEPIAGVEIEGKGTATTEQHIVFVATHKEKQEVTASGELEISNGIPAGTSNRCTWKLTAS